MQEVKGRRSEAKGGEDHSGRSCDELILEMAEEYGFNRLGENNDDVEENKDDEGNAVAPPAPALAVVPEEIV
jgi:hypothetical protein